MQCFYQSGGAQEVTEARIGRELACPPLHTHVCLPEHPKAPCLPRLHYRTQKVTWAVMLCFLLEPWLRKEKDARAFWTSSIAFPVLLLFLLAPSHLPNKLHFHQLGAPGAEAQWLAYDPPLPGHAPLRDQPHSSEWEQLRQGEMGRKKPS